MVAKVEQGQPASVITYVRLAAALGLKPSFALHTERSTWSNRDRDAVHAAVGEVEALGYELLIDEPYQHYQFAGRADVVAINRPGRAMIHLENRTRFPDIQEFAGAFNAKRAYLAQELARRHGLPRLDTVTHVVVALWSSEVLHAVRRRLSTFQSLCPDPDDALPPVVRPASHRDCHVVRAPGSHRAQRVTPQGMGWAGSRAGRSPAVSGLRGGPGRAA
jgi:hypothetical protein